jgi:hypothetical protein
MAHTMTGKVTLTVNFMVAQFNLDELALEASLEEYPYILDEGAPAPAPVGIGHESLRSPPTSNDPFESLTYVLREFDLRTRSGWRGWCLRQAKELHPILSVIGHSYDPLRDSLELIVPYAVITDETIDWPMMANIIGVRVSEHYASAARAWMNAIPDGSARLQNMQIEHPRYVLCPRLYFETTPACPH